MPGAHALSSPDGPDARWGDTTYHGSAPIPLRAATPGESGKRGGDSSAKDGHLPYAAGLDGVRALAVAAVVVFHLGASWLAGGFLGVDVFFALSGFLITSILVREFQNRGRIDVKNFYLRRARRLLPALFTLLAAVTLLTWLFAREEMHRLRGDVIAALTYCTNWTQIVWNRGYFAQLSRPSLLQHLWSLAVEEQFYLVWPLVLVACLAARRRWIAFAVPVGLSGLSLLLMASMYHAGQDPARVYYGSDTHASLMLLGAAMAIVIAFRREVGRARDTAAGRAAADVAALAGLIGLVWAATHITYYSPGLYQGGYFLVALAACGLIYAAGRAGTVTSRVLGTAPLVWVGQRSYAIYLWHWPILMLSRPGADLSWPKPIIIAMQLAATVIASDLSYRYIERPIRSNGLMNTLRGITRTRHGLRRPAAPSRSRPVAISAAVTAVLAVVIATLGSAPASAPAGIQVDQTHPRPTLSIPAAAPTSHTSSGHRRTVRHAGKPAIGRSSSRVAHPVPLGPPFPRPVRVSFFGDSQGMTLLLNKPDGLQKAMTLSDSTVEGCGMLLGTITSRTGYSRDLAADCGSWPQLWAANAAKNHPQIAVIEVGAWDVFDLTVNGRKMTFGSPPWDAYYEQQLHKGISILTGAGAQVALMGVPCYRPIAAGGLPLLPERGDDSRTRHLNTLLAAAAKADPQHVFMISPPAQFCTDPKIASNTAYRWDGTHYYIPGAALVFQVITPQLLAIPQPPPR